MVEGGVEPAKLVWGLAVLEVGGGPHHDPKWYPMGLSRPAAVGGRPDHLRCRGFAQLVETVIASNDDRHDRKHVKLFSAESVRPPAWLAVPVNILKRRFPRLNSAIWNAQYRLGIWKYLDTSLDSGSEILGLVDEYAPNPRILDLGCGTSANLPLTPGRYRHYHGVDISAAAIRQAEALERAHASFEVADIITYSTTQKYDAILLREVLYYFLPEQAAQLLIRLAGFLEPGGKIFIQVFESVDEVVRSSGLCVLYRRTTADGAPGGAVMVLGIDAHSS